MAEDYVLEKCDLVGMNEFDPEGDVILVFNSKHVVVSDPLEVNLINAEEWNSTAKHQVEVVDSIWNTTNEGQGEGQKKKVIYELDTADIEFRVSSRHLSLLSSYFRALLSKNFAEGKALHTSGHVRIVMEGDAAHGAKIVLGLLHHDYKIPSMTPSLMMQTATSIDKWDLSSQLSFLTRDMWTTVEDHMPTVWDLQSESYLKILYMLNFKDELIERAVLYAKKLTDNVSCDFPPVQQIMERFARYRIHVLRRIFSLISLLIQQYCRGTPDHGQPWCDVSEQSCDDNVLGALIRELSSSDIYPIPTNPYQGVSVESLRKGLEEMVWKPCSHGLTEPNSKKRKADGTFIEDKLTDEVQMIINELIRLQQHLPYVGQP